MRSCETVFFDLDGTLTDPGRGITNSVAYALNKFGIENTDRTELYKFIGPPLEDSFICFYGFTREQAKLAVKYYREYFSVDGLFENEVYAGTERLLSRLRADGKKLAVATSKPEEYSIRILEHFGLAGYFDVIAGTDMEGLRVKKADVIDYALRRCDIKDRDSVLMVGDREHDVIGARENGIDCVGVLFGYGDRRELERAGAVYIAETMDDIYSFISQRSR